MPRAGFEPATGPVLIGNRQPGLQPGALPSLPRWEQAELSRTRRLPRRLLDTEVGNRALFRNKSCAGTSSGFDLSDIMSEKKVIPSNRTSKPSLVIRSLVPERTPVSEPGSPDFAKRLSTLQRRSLLGSCVTRPLKQSRESLCQRCFFL